MIKDIKNWLETLLVYSKYFQEVKLERYEIKNIKECLKWLENPRVYAVMEREAIPDENGVPIEDWFLSRVYFSAKAAEDYIKGLPEPPLDYEIDEMEVEEEYTY
jgi:hypothetical protein